MPMVVRDRVMVIVVKCRCHYTGALLDYDLCVCRVPSRPMRSMSLCPAHAPVAAPTALIVLPAVCLHGVWIVLSQMLAVMCRVWTPRCASS